MATIKRIVLFADGTGNAFTLQESNVWRLYQALDLSQADQVAHYIPGVGTSRFKPYAIFDGATGIGVPSNVRELYRFLCLNWQTGVEIYLFGFSRGAFTIRTLIGLIAAEGLVAAAMPGPPGASVPVSHATMARNVMAAWRSYRAASPRREMLTIRLTRWLRDRFLALANRLSGANPYSEVRKSNRLHVPVKFAGVFDTVEAYGVPFEELRRAVDRVIWPISFHNQKLTPLVERARHALSLDDERVTFHPIRFDVRDETDIDRIHEVWFSGVHSDVGGGYPDDALAYVPLRWMLEESLAASGGGLRFKQGTQQHIQQSGSVIADIHDSRTGLAVIYRYGPRIIATPPDPTPDAGVPLPPADGTTPVLLYPPTVHHSVVDKIVFGSNRYAPLVLPHQVQVLMPDASIQNMEGFLLTAALIRSLLPDNGAILMNIDQDSDAPLTRPATGIPFFYHGGTIQAEDQARTRDALDRLGSPNRLGVDWTRDLIWWRRFAYLALVSSLILVALLPAAIAWLDGTRYGNNSISGGAASVVAPLVTALGGIIPGYAAPWTRALAASPLIFTGACFLVLAAFLCNGHLRDRIADMAGCTWLAEDSQAGNKDLPRRPLAADLVRRIRKSGRAAAAAHAFSNLLPYALIAILVFAIVPIGAFRLLTGYQEGAGSYCAEPTSPLKPVVAAATVGPFTPRNPCWPSGLSMEKGRSYRITLVMDPSEPFQDGATLVGIAGFDPATIKHWGRRWLYLAAMPLRRRWDADWFAPIARIGRLGNAEFPLLPRDGITRRDLTPITASSTPAVPSAKTSGPCVASAVSVLLPDTPPARRTMVADFTAQADGELYLFVNDAILSAAHTCFYDNNRGGASVTVEPLPPVVSSASPKA